MKRIYRYDHRTQRVTTSFGGIAGFLVKYWKRMVVAVVALMAVLFLLSCFLVLSEARIWPVTAETSNEVAATPADTPAAPELAARAAVLMDEESGRLLYEKNAHLRLPMASTTKIMTALVAKEQLELKDQVSISQAAADVGEQEIWLEPGEVLTVEELLWALLVQSANDAAHALAEFCAGSTEAFASLMNRRAEELGASDTHFMNPHGLDEPDHYSSAYDLAVMGRQLLEDPLLADIVKHKTCELPWPGHPEPRTCVSHNQMLVNYSGATGIKTGYTEDAGFCIVASATRDEKSLIAVVLNSEYRESDTANLLDWGFDATERVVLVSRGQRFGRSRVSSYPRRYTDVVAESEIAALSVKGSGDVFQVEASYRRKTGDSVEKGNKLGKVTCKVGGTRLSQEDLVAGGTVGKPGPLLVVVFFLWYTLCWMGKIVWAPFRVL